MKHSIKHSTKYKTRKYKTRKSIRIKKSYKGGDLTAKPYQTLGFPNGASSEREAALRVGQSKDQAQHAMNKTGGRGGGVPQYTEVQANVSAEGAGAGAGTRGGTRSGGAGTSIPPGTMVVPQFPPIGGIKTAYTTSGLSSAGNLSSLVGTVDSSNDHFATEQSGGRRRRKTYRKSRRNTRL